MNFWEKSDKMKNLLKFFGFWLVILNPTSEAQLADKKCTERRFEDTEGIHNPFVKAIINSQSHKTLPQLIKSNGFPVEIHTVTSFDGYITTLFRIPHGRFPKNDTFPKKVVYLHHGIVVDAGSWILNSVNKALAYRLADTGNIDVWMGNSRGTINSLKHVNINEDNYQYWNFSFHEIGIQDVPRIIDYVLDVSNQTDMYYIGHSMGCNELLVALCYFPEYNSKIRTFIGLAPAVFIGHASTALQTIAPELVQSSKDLHDAFLMRPIVQPGLLPGMSIVGDFCSPRVIFHRICWALVESFFGYDPKEEPYDNHVEIVAHGFSSASTKSLFHLLQLTLSGDFSEYDYGKKRNLQVYGQSYPPKYELNRVTVPTVLACGDEDNIVPCVDARKLAQNLNMKEFIEISLKTFTHIDFMYSPDINPLLNDRILEIVTNDLYYKK